MVHGVSDSLPLSAGLYESNSSTKNVTVKFEPYKEYPPQDIKIEWQAPWQIFPLANTFSMLTLDNTQGMARYHIDAHVISHNFAQATDELTRITVLPPYARAQVPLLIQKGQYLK